MNNNDLNLIKKLSELNGISGHEKDVASFIKEELKDSADEIFFDSLGSVIAKQSGKENAPTIMLSAHIDEVGFVVSKIEDSGFLRMSPIGGWWPHVVLAQQFIVTNKLGKKYFAVTGAEPPHGRTREEMKKVLDFNDMYLDLGVSSKEDIINLGIEIGDPITPYIDFKVLNDGSSLLGKAFDDRLGVAVAIKAFKKLKNTNHDANLYFSGTVQEEIGCKGAKTSSYMIKPDIALAIDVTSSYDVPDSPNYPCKLNSGVSLSIVDGGLIAHRGLFNFVEDIAKKNNIRYTYDLLTAGATDAKEISVQNSGVISLTVSIPCRYYHSHVSIINYNDYVEATKLIIEVVKALNNETLSCLKESKYQ